MVGRKNLYISLWWATMLSTLRLEITALDQILMGPTKNGFDVKSIQRARLGIYTLDIFAHNIKIKR